MHGWEVGADGGGVRVIFDCVDGGCLASRGTRQELMRQIDAVELLTWRCRCLRRMKMRVVVEMHVREV